MKKIAYILFFLVACLPENNFDKPLVQCEEPNIVATHTFEQIKAMAGFGIVTFSEDAIIEGYVVSDDKSGNIYKYLYLQDHPTNPTLGLKFSIDNASLFAVFPKGRKVFVNLNGLSIGYSFGAQIIGKANGAEIERVPNTELFQYFTRSCETYELLPTSINVNDFTAENANLLVSLENVQFLEKDIGQSLGAANTQTVDKKLVQLNDACEVIGEFEIKISGFADFKNYTIPKNKGTVTGILTPYYSEYQLLIRDVEDLLFESESCTVVKNQTPTVTLQEIIDLYQGNVVEFGVADDLLIEGYVVSTDQFGNFTNTLVIQDKPENPTVGLQIKIDSDAIYEEVALGERVLLRLNKLYLDKIEGNFTVGVYDDASVAAIPDTEMGDYLIGTDELETLVPKAISFDQLKQEDFANVLLEVTDAQLQGLDLGKAFAYFSGIEMATRYIGNCDSFSAIGVVTEGTADFAHQVFPKGKGAIVGVAYLKNDAWQLKVRDQSDVAFENNYEACELVEPKIMITEIADPANTIDGRFVELYNAGEKALLLNGWKLRKYINGSTSVSGTAFDLSGLVIGTKGFIVIGGANFEAIYGIKPSIISNYITGNGDDVYELVDGSGNTRDVFGIIGEDGSGKNWEYIDGKAVRKNTILNPNTTFDIIEWMVFSKSNSTAQNAPDDFSPFQK